MTLRDARAVGAPYAPEDPEAPYDEPIYTRYCAAPHPAHPIGEPRLVHTLMVATWLGRLIDPLPHKVRRDAHM
jgi:hypothetical protein